MKQFIVLLLTLCTLLTACAEGYTPYKTGNDAPAEESARETYGCEEHYRIAIIADFGPFDGFGYDAECYRGINRFIEKTDGNDLLYYSPTEDSTDARIACIEQAVEEGARIVVLPGYSFALALIQMQEKYPDVYFLGIDITEGEMTEDYIEYRKPTPNTACVTFASEEAGWLAGYAAVKEGYRKLGFASMIAVPQVINYGYGFLMGADAAAQELGVDIEMRYGYDQHPHCTEQEYEMVRTWCESGTEVIFECFPENIDYIVNEYSCRTITCDTFDSPGYDCLLSAAEKRLDNAVTTLLTSIYDGTWDTYSGKFTELSLADGDYLSLNLWDFENFTEEDYGQVLAELKNGTRPLPDVTNHSEFPTLSKHTTLIEES